MWIETKTGFFIII